MWFPALLVQAAALRWLRQLGGAGLLLFATADSSPLPLPGGGTDLLVILLAARRAQWWGYYAAMATIGSVLGGYLSFRVARVSGAKTLEARLGERRARAVVERITRHGWGLIAAGALLPPPFPFTAMVMAAGVARLPAGRLVGALTAARAVRYTVAAFLGYEFGRPMLQVVRRMRATPLQLWLGAGIVTAVGAAVVLAVWLRHRWARPA